MTSPQASVPDPVEALIEGALSPNEFISDHGSQCYDFVSSLEVVSGEVQELIASDPQRAVRLYEVFLAGCTAKAEEVDDSSGTFGTFAGTVLISWVAARQAAEADPNDTAQRILHWIDGDQYGFSNGIATALASAFTPRGATAFLMHLRQRWDGYVAAARPVSAAGVASARKTPWAMVSCGLMIRAFLLARGDLSAYSAFADETGVTAADCHAIARMQQARQHWPEALAWIERGRALAAQDARFGPDPDFTVMHREVLVKLGRQAEARDDAWLEFRANPHSIYYQRFMDYVPTSERSSWHQKALELMVHAPLDCCLPFLLETKEMSVLVQRIRCSSDAGLEELSHVTSEPIAKALETVDAEQAARLWQAQGMRILASGKSTYYAAALANFANAKRLYASSGHDAHWQALLRRVQMEHHRKTAVVQGLGRVASGEFPTMAPSFLERAKAKFSL